MLNHTPREEDPSLSSHEATFGHRFAYTSEDELEGDTAPVQPPESPFPKPLSFDHLLPTRQLSPSDYLLHLEHQADDGTFVTETLPGAEVSRAAQEIGNVVVVDHASSSEFGAHYDPERRVVSFSVPADPTQVTGLRVLLFNERTQGAPAYEIPMEQTIPGLFSVTLSGDGVEPGMYYGLRPEGPGVDGDQFHWIVDPYAKAMVAAQWITSLSPGSSQIPRADDFVPPKGVVPFPPSNDARPDKVSIPDAKRVIYELHVPGFEQFPLDRVPEEFKDTRGTLTFLQSPPFIEHMRKLGITTVEIMPLHQLIDEWPVFSAGRENVWGYMAANFFALNPRFCHQKDELMQIDELKRTIDVLHEHGFEVILDFVGGHTAEGNKDTPYNDSAGAIKGPTVNLRGLADHQYYHVNHDGVYLDATGCQHTVNINTALGEDLILRARDYWINEIGFDGLRIDQAPVFGARNTGNEVVFDKDHPFLEKFADCDGVIIAEPGWRWGVMKGAFGGAWKEQIFEDREINRYFFSGREHHYERWQGIVQTFADTLAGYSNVYGEVNRSIRFADCHDGLTTWDATKYMLQDLVKGEILRFDPTKDPERARDVRIALARAIHASVVYAPGPFMINRGAELLHDQQLHPDPFDRKDLNTLEWDFSEPSMGTHRAAFLEYLARCVELRKELGVFERVETYQGSNQLQWVGRNGDIVERGVKHNPHEKGRRWGAQDRYLGALYTEPVAEGEHGLGSIVFVARSGVPGQIVLPSTGKFHEWERVLDSTKGDPFAREVFDGRAPYRFALPGIGVFKLVRKEER